MMRLGFLHFLKKGFDKFLNQVKQWTSRNKSSRLLLHRSRYHYHNSLVKQSLVTWKTNQRRFLLAYQWKIRATLFYKLFRELKGFRKLKQHEEDQTMKRRMLLKAEERQQSHLQKQTLYLFFHRIFDDEIDPVLHHSHRYHRSPFLSDLPSQQKLQQTEERHQHYLSLRQTYHRKLSLKYYLQQWKNYQYEERKERYQRHLGKASLKVHLTPPPPIKYSTSPLYTTQEILSKTMEQPSRDDYTHFPSTPPSHNRQQSSLSDLAKAPPRKVKYNLPESLTSITQNKGLIPLNASPSFPARNSASIQNSSSVANNNHNSDLAHREPKRFPQQSEKESENSYFRSSYPHRHLAASVEGTASIPPYFPFPSSLQSFPTGLNKKTIAFNGSEEMILDEIYELLMANQEKLMKSKENHPILEEIQEFLKHYEKG